MYLASTGAAFSMPYVAMTVMAVAVAVPVFLAARMKWRVFRHPAQLFQMLGPALIVAGFALVVCTSAWYEHQGALPDFALVLRSAGFLLFVLGYAWETKSRARELRSQ